MFLSCCIPGLIPAAGMGQDGGGQMVNSTAGGSLTLPGAGRRQDSLTVKTCLTDVSADSALLLLGSFKTESHILKKQNRSRNT